jgi:hypothetical protein
MPSGSQTYSPPPVDGLYVLDGSGRSARKYPVVNGRKMCGSCRRVLVADAFYSRCAQCKDCMCRPLPPRLDRDSLSPELEFKAEKARVAHRRREYRRWKKSKEEDPDAHRLMVRDHGLRTKFGITLEQYEEMSERQLGLCAICVRPESIEGASLSVDHCHSTGLVRGLLCRTCNSAIGFLGDDPSMLQRAIDYLEGK